MTLSERFAETIEKQFESIAERLQHEYHFLIVGLESHGPYVNFVIKNKYSFIHTFWSPQDGLDFSIGPLVGNEIPDEIVEYTPGVMNTHYGLGELAIAAGRKNEEVFGFYHKRIEDAARTLLMVIEYLSELKPNCLSGDWSNREKLENIIEKEYYENLDG